MRKSPGRSKTPIIKMPKQQNIVVKSAQIIKINEIRDRFRRQIVNPISKIQQISQAKSPQRCLIHNIIFTLYCEFDRKPICASCMYQQQTHKKHRVLPLPKATSLIKQDIMGFQNKLQYNMNQCYAISRRLQQIIIKNQRFYPSVIGQLKKYYQD